MVTPVTNTHSISSRSLIGVVVKDAHGDALGEIEALWVSLESGCVSNLILSTQGLLEDKRVAIPWDVLKIDEETQALHLDVTKDFLQRLPAYQGE